MKLLTKKAYLSIFAVIALSSSQLYANDFKTDNEKESYGIGSSTGQYVGNQIIRQHELGLETDVDRVIEGFVDALQNKLKLKEEEIIDHLNNRAERLNKAQEALIAKIKSDNKIKEDKFLAQNKKKQGVKTTKSGLQYEVIAKGKGSNTKPESIAIVNYKTSSLDGIVFEENLDKENPTQLSMVNIIDGLREGLLLMNEGSKYKFYIPSKLAYKDEQTMNIEPNTTLVFEVELQKILKPGDLRPKEKFEIIMEENKKNKLDLDKK